MLCTFCTAARSCGLLPALEPVLYSVCTSCTRSSICITIGFKPKPCMASVPASCLSTLQLWSAGMLQGASGSGLQPLLRRCYSRSSGLHLQPAPANLCTSRAWPPAHCISTRAAGLQHPAESLLGWSSPSLPAASSAGRALQGSCLQSACTPGRPA